MLLSIKAWPRVKTKKEKEDVCMEGRKSAFQGIMKKAALSFLASFMLFSAIAMPAQAKVLFAYNGTGIWSRPSVHTAQVNNKTCKVTHSQKRVITGNNYQQMTVYVQRDQGLGKWQDVGSKTFKNDASGSFTTYCSTGKYRLYFYSGSGYNKFNISGTFSY